MGGVLLRQELSSAATAVVGGGSGFRSRQEPGPDSLVRGFLRRMCHCAMRELTDRKRGSTDLGLAIEICDNNKIEREAWVGNR